MLNHPIPPTLDCIARRYGMFVLLRQRLKPRLFKAALARAVTGALRVLTANYRPRLHHHGPVILRREC